MKRILASVAVALAWASGSVHRPAGPPGVEQPLHLRGAIHVHTAASRDATGSVGAVAAAAREAGLDFVVVTDHNTEASVGIDAWHDGVLVIGGLEKSTDAGHLLALRLTRLPYRLDGDPATVVDDVGGWGGFTVVAHPEAADPESRWTGDVAAAEAMEFLSLSDPGHWTRGPRLVLALARAVWDPQGALLSLFRPGREALDLWDRALAKRPAAGVLGSDAHGGLRVGSWHVPFPRHRDVFRLASHHVHLESPLSHDASVAAGQVLEALRAGHGYGAVDTLAAADSFQFEVECGGRRAGMGDALLLEGQATMTVGHDGPEGTEIVVRRDGAEIHRGTGRTATYETGAPGVYRVEVFLPPAAVPRGFTFPWIVSNPVRLLKSPPAPPVAEHEAVTAAEADTWIERFDGDTLPAHWHSDATAAEATLAPEDGTLRLDYRLGPGHVYHAAAAYWRHLDLGRDRALSFRVRASAPLRFDLQVRTLDPAGRQGVRIWRRSVRADGEWRTVILPLTQLKTYDGRGGEPRLSEVGGLYFHIDESNLRPGSTGTLWIDDVGRHR